MAVPLRQRLLRDVAELQTAPYPNTTLHVNDSLTQACLVLSPVGQDSLHLTMVFHDDYPLHAPVVTIQSGVSHPNVFGNYICASILNTKEGYTPAYTLKSIAIQLLSFFSSDTLEQDYGAIQDLGQYRQLPLHIRNKYYCTACGFDDEARRREQQAIRLEEYSRWVTITNSRQCLKKPALLSEEDSSKSGGAGRRRVKASKLQDADQMELDEVVNEISPVNESAPSALDSGQRLIALPDEILLMTFSELSDQDLWAMATAFPWINEILNSYDFIRVRELQCFCLKESFMKVKLGVGVHIHRRGREGTFESEFDLLSQQAFRDYEIRTSVQGLGFEHWLPLPISRRHWRSVRAEVSGSLGKLAHAASLKDKSDISVIYQFMNDIVVNFSQEAEKCFDYDSQSSLTHASEKAVESYFALFHLLLCLATENPRDLYSANAKINEFLAGETSKSSCPNLGHLLVAALICDDGVTEQLRIAIIKEAVLRNVVWMLDPTGANMPELAYLEPSATSEYRLRRTFQASKTSYRLLMFLNLFYETARGGTAASLTNLRNKIFDAHGGPPRGTAEHMAAEIRTIKDIDAFPQFFINMGVRDMPSKENFTAFLRRMVSESVSKGYSCMPMTQGEALALRKRGEPGGEVAEGVACGLVTEKTLTASFFPGGSGRRGGGGGTRGRERGRARRY